GGAERRRGERGERQRPEKGPSQLADERRGRVHAGAEKGGVSERKVARIAGEQVPRRGEHDRVREEVQERFVERRQARERHGAEQHDAGCNSEPHQNFAGRKRSRPISSENETRGAQVGAVSAIVRASLTPMATPATSGPSARPRPPIITAANTTPIHA